MFLRKFHHVHVSQRKFHHFHHDFPRETAAVSPAQHPQHPRPEEFYLHALVLPSLLRHADAKLSANGQDLGGEVRRGARRVALK